jgi:hypothetical protein
LRRVASGLMMESVRSTAMGSSEGVESARVIGADRDLGKNPPDP